MAPEIAFDFLSELRSGAVVLDPMCGSGVSLRSALEKQYDAIGFDADPLAVLMSRVWTSNSKHQKLSEFAQDVVERARKRTSFQVPWHDDETERFIDYWFANRQKKDLARLALSLHGSRKLPSYASEAMRIAISRLIITKTKGASLAWDVSHSQGLLRCRSPHSHAVQCAIVCSLHKKLSPGKGCNLPCQRTRRGIPPKRGTNFHCDDRVRAALRLPILD
jgi:hypothetical protein